MSKKSKTKARDLGWHEIAVLAYDFWEKEGRPEGRALDHWLQAEWLLKARLAEEAGQNTEND